MSTAHWLIVLVIVLLMFGPSRLSSLGKGLGEGIRSFKEGLNGDGESDEKAIQKEKPTTSEKSS
ncbi:MAG TPA: twin-arginine translocase TatA/TatE family subunit [Polyangiaceae bacterium]|nr:twin-arginine translocase TatA/TatE family subunit [Polyangiaceae bacterium]